MATKAEIINLEGKKLKEIELPEFFSQKIREDTVAKILEIGKTRQPYGPSPVAGKQHAASGKIVHRRHVWRSGYGRGMSRVPRKILSRKGSQFNWVGAEVASTRGGRRAHPPKPGSMINTKKVNKKEMRTALLSALSATADKKSVLKKYGNLMEKDLRGLPLIVESKIISLKTKELLDNLKNILGENLFALVSKNKKIRAGKGKRRGRKHRSNAGLLLVMGSKEKIDTRVFEAKNVKNLSIMNLAGGGLGRLVIYTEEAIKNLQEKFGEKK